MTTQQKPIELYFWPTPNGRKISIMLEELGVPYNLNMVNIGAGDQFKPEFLSISPNNRIPAIVDPEGPDGEPISIFESGAILQYLGEKFGRFYPVSPRERIRVNEWLFWQMGGFGPMLGQNHHFGSYAPEQVPYAIKRYRDEAHRLYTVLEKQLSGRDYITGDYSIADIACVDWANSHARQDIVIDEFPNVKNWLARVNARPAVERGLAIGREERKQMNYAKDKGAQSVLFGQRGVK